MDFGSVSSWLQLFIAFIFYKGTYHANINYELIFNPTDMTYAGAATWCEMKGGSLVTLDSMSAIHMVEYYKDNDWSSQWNQHVWTGLYSFDASSGYWHGTCYSLSFTYYDTGQTYSSIAPCTYMANNDLKWYYDLCTSSHHVVCQVPRGDCAFDSNDNKIDSKATIATSVTSSTLVDCQNDCHNYLDGNNQCWAIRYQASAQKCDLYASVNPLEYFSTQQNNNNNYFYSSRECFSSAIIQEPEPLSSMNVSAVIKDCAISTEAEKTTEHFTTDKETSTEYLTSGQETSTEHLTSGQETSTEHLTSGHKISTELFTATKTGDHTSDSLTQKNSIHQEFSTNSISNSISTVDQTTNIQSQDYTTISHSTTKPTSYSHSTIQHILGTTKGESSTSLVSTTVEADSEECSFQCPCDFASQNITAEMLQERIEELKAILTVEKTTTSAYIRKHTSAKDNRPSSKAIGALGIIIIVLTLVFIVGMDLISMVQFCKHKKILKRLCRRRQTKYTSDTG